MPWKLCLHYSRRFTIKNNCGVEQVLNCVLVRIKSLFFRRKLSQEMSSSGKDFLLSYLFSCFYNRKHLFIYFYYFYHRELWKCRQFCSLHKSSRLFIVHLTPVTVTYSWSPVSSTRTPYQVHAYLLVYLLDLAKKIHIYILLYIIYYIYFRKRCHF